MSEFEVRDWLGGLITVGSKCRYGAPDDPADPEYVVEVVAISDPDADYCDEIGRARRINPQVTVRFPDGAEERVSTSYASPVTWADYPDGPAVEQYEADDLERLAEPAEAAA